MSVRMEAAMPLDALLNFLRRLDDAGISYHLGSYRDSVNVHVTTPSNERWEVEFVPSGEIEVERFVSNGQMDDESALEDLFAKFSDEEPAARHDTPSR